MDPLLVLTLHSGGGAYPLSALTRGLTLLAASLNPPSRWGDLRGVVQNGAPDMYLLESGASKCGGWVVVEIPKRATLG